MGDAGPTAKRAKRLLEGLKLNGISGPAPRLTYMKSEWAESGDNSRTGEERRLPRGTRGGSARHVSICMGENPVLW